MHFALDTNQIATRNRMYTAGTNDVMKPKTSVVALQKCLCLSAAILPSAATKIKISKNIKFVSVEG